MNERDWVNDETLAEVRNMLARASASRASSAQSPVRPTVTNTHHTHHAFKKPSSSPGVVRTALYTDRRVKSVIEAARERG